MLFECIKYDAPSRIIFLLQTHLSKAAQKNMLKAWNFTKNKIYHKCFDNNLKKLFGTKILKNSNEQIILIVALMVRLWPKLQMEIVDQNNPIFNHPPSLHVSIWILRTASYPSAKARPGTSQATKVIICVNSLSL